MQYMLLIYENEAEMQKRSAAEIDTIIKEYGSFTDSIVKSGQFRAGDPLESSATATVVRVRNGKTLTSDGPYAETKEQLGGYYIIEANDLDEAVAVAARVPCAREFAVEVRPIMKLEQS